LKSVFPSAKTIVEKTQFEQKLVEAEKSLFLPKRIPEETSAAIQHSVHFQTASTTEKIQPKSTEEKCAQEEQLPSERKALNLRFLSQLKNSYLLAEDADGLVLIDQHAAHERILYERLSEIIKGEGVKIQQMLVPVMLELSSGEVSLLEANLTLLKRLGFDLRPFGNNTYIIDAVPEYIKTAIQEKVIRDVLDTLKQERRPSSAEREEAVQYAVCHAAVKAHDSLTESEVLKLIKDLNECDSPYTCPHGRPTMLRMPMKDIEKHFHRR
jgi:DNA mismatch repair protein MutL